MTSDTMITAQPATLHRLESAALAAFLAFVAALQLSIAVAQILLTLTLLLWVAVMIVRHERPDAPAMFWPLVAYAGVTLVAVVFSFDPSASFVDSKQLVLFVIVPVVYKWARGASARAVSNVVVSVGAIVAAYGIVQYGILEFDSVAQRPLGTMGHAMTYSGMLMLVIAHTAARLLFDQRDRTWPALVLPALLVALALTYTRNAWVGAWVAVGLLMMLKDLRLLFILPIVAALFMIVAPPHLTDRLSSIFDMENSGNRARFTLARVGARMVRTHPLTGVGPGVVQNVYAEYSDGLAVEGFDSQEFGATAPSTVHLHNVPMQIAAERGLPTLAIWVWFIVVVVRGLLQKLRASPHRALAAGGLAAVAGMLAAGMFEYNFGDSEFLMLFLVLITLPFAVDRTPNPQPLAPNPQTSVSA